MEKIIKERIEVTIAAYAYEFLNESFLTDFEYDELCKKVKENIHIKTGNKKWDKWFIKNFNADSGMWVHNHPDKSRLKFLYNEYYSKKKGK